MTDFYFVRLDKVDVLRYLPKFLSQDKAFTNVQNALSEEHEHYRLFLPGIAKQFFIESATWGLPSWENVYRTNPAYDTDVEQRRVLVKAKMLGRRPITKKHLEVLINLFTKRHDAYVEEDVAPGCIKIHFPSVILWQRAMEEMLDATVPAHLMYDLHFEKDNADASVFFGAAPSLHTICEVCQELVRDEAVQVQRRIGAVLSVHNVYAVTQT